MPTDRSDKYVLRFEILVDNSLVVDAVKCSSQAAPQVIRNMQRDRAALFLVQLQRVLDAGFCYDDEVTTRWIVVLRYSSYSVDLQRCCDDWVTCKTATMHHTTAIEY